MKVYFWQMGNTGYFDQLVLWDGENTYWTEEMRPSSGYKDINTNIYKRKYMRSRFFYIGDL